MINEVFEAKEYLNGNNINKKCLYHICYILSKWYKEKGLSNIEIRHSIFKWAEKYNIYITYSLNNIIYNAIEDNEKLRDNVIVKINDNDKKEIISRFDSKNSMLTALAMLCLAKVKADKENEFSISSIVLGTWVGIADSNLRGKYIKELIDFEYLTKIENCKPTYSWEKETRSKCCNYRINVPLHNSGKYILVNNDIKDLFNKVFC